MKSLLGVFLLLGAPLFVGCGSAFAHGPVDAVEVHFGPAPAPAVGSSAREMRSYEGTFDGHLSLHGHGVSSSGKLSGREVRDERILAVDGKATKKISVTYVEHSEMHSVDGEDKQSEADPRLGKTYIVDATQPKVSITDQSGGQVPESEALLVIKDYGLLGTADRIVDELPSAALRPGEPFDKLCGKAKSEADRSQVDLSQCSITFRGRRGDNAVFEIRVVAEGHESEARVKFSLDGELLVRIADRQLTKFAGSGDLEIGATSGEASLDGEGHIDIDIERTLRP